LKPDAGKAERYIAAISALYVALNFQQMSFTLKIIRKRRSPMDPWLIFAELCRRVVEDQNVILNVYFGATGIEMSLTPLDEDDLDIDD
jgi:hypothetical protein